MIHELKIKREYFLEVISGKKTYEVRKADRPFCEGDILALNEILKDKYTGRSCLVVVDSILNEPEYVKEGFVILGIKPCELRLITEPFYNPVNSRLDYSVPLATDYFSGEKTNADSH